MGKPTIRVWKKHGLFAPEKITLKQLTGITNDLTTPLPEFGMLGVNDTPPPPTVGVTGCSSIVCARQLEHNAAPSQQKAVPGQCSLGTVRQWLLQTAWVDGSGQTLNGQTITITQPIG